MWNFSSGVCFAGEEGSTGSHPGWTDRAVADIGHIPAVLGFSGAGECYSKHELQYRQPLHQLLCKDKTGFLYLRS